jgi:hypothetical protein
MEFNAKVLQLDEKILVVIVGCIVISFSAHVLPVIFISYIFLSILERNFEPADSLYNAPCSRHLDKTLSFKANC